MASVNHSALSSPTSSSIATWRASAHFRRALTPRAPPRPEGASGRETRDLPEVVFPAGEGAALQGRAVGLHVAGVVELRLEGVAHAHAAGHERRGRRPAGAQREPREARRHGCGTEERVSGSSFSGTPWLIAKINGAGDYTDRHTHLHVHKRTCTEALNINTGKN